MAKLLKNGKYACSYCKKPYHLMGLALGCEKEHHLIYVPISKGDLLKLIQFLYAPESISLPENLMRQLTIYSRLKVEEDEPMSSMQE